MKKMVRKDGDVAEIQEIPACLPRINPFVHKKSEWDDPVDKFKTIILTIILLPFRTICIMVLLVLAWLLAHIGLYGLSREELTSKPLTGWRRNLRAFIALIMRVIFVASSFNYIKYIGKRAEPAVAPIICVGPHSSFVDSLCVIVMGPSAVVAKKETASLPFFGKLIDYTQPIYVCREDPDSRQKTIQGIIERANSKEDWSQILIFPEGTCTNRSSLIQFKPGAFYPGVPIQPVLLRYPNKMDTVTWTWEGPDVVTLLWRTMTQFHTFCEIEYLPVYVPNEEEKRNPKLFAKNVQHLMAKALNIPVSDYTFDDCKLMNYAKIMTLPYAAAMADLDKMRLRLGLVDSNIEEKLVATNTFEPDNSWVELFAFADALQVEVNSCTVTLFNLFNRKQNSDNRDIIDFREYLLCTLFLITLGTPKINFIKALFQLNANKAGQISREAFHNSVKYSLLKLTPEKIDLLFLSIDEDNLGFITFDKFQTYTKKRKEFSRLYGPSEHEKLRH